MIIFLAFWLGDLLFLLRFLFLLLLHHPDCCRVMYFYSTFLFHYYYYYYYSYYSSTHFWIPIFLAYLVPLDVDVVPIKFHQFLLGE
jgi:hypothetical protein